MKKDMLSKNILSLAIIILFVTMVWLGYEVYSISNKRTITEVSVPENLLQPIDPSINEELLNSMRDRIYR